MLQLVTHAPTLQLYPEMLIQEESTVQLPKGGDEQHHRVPTAVHFSVHTPAQHNPGTSPIEHELPLWKTSLPHGAAAETEHVARLQPGFTPAGSVQPICGHEHPV